MFKFLRKYNKIILAVGGTLLLIVFLIPQAIQSLSQRAALRSADVATVGVNNEDVSIDRWTRVQMETQLIEQMQQSFAQQQQRLFPVLGIVKDPEHWYLLTREAEQLGLIAPRPYTGQLSETQLGNMARNAGMSRRALLETLAKIEGVGQMVRLYLQAGELSDRRLKQFARQMFHGVAVQTVPIAADPQRSDYTPTEQELQEQLEAYGHLQPGEGEYGFGYRLPDRAKIEWLSIPVDVVRETVAQSDDINNRVLYRHWIDNAGQRGLPPVEEEGSGPPPQSVRDDLITQRTNETLDRIEKFAYDKLRIPQRTLTRSDGFYTLPDDWTGTRVDFTQLADQLRQRFEIPTPEYRSTGGDWTPVQELSQLEGVGQATTQRYGTLATNLVQLVQRAKSFGGDGTVPIQVGVAGPPLRGRDGSVYVFRLIGADPARPPRSVDEVREQLVTDLQKLHHYQQLTQRIDEIKQQANSEGLLPLALEYDAEVQASDHLALYDPNKYLIDTQMQQRGLSARPSPVPGLGPAPDVLEQIVDWAMEFPPDADLSELPLEQRTRIFPVEDRLTLLVVRLTGQKPLTDADFKQLSQNAQLESLLLGEEFNDIQDIREAFSFEALARRHNFKFTRSQDEDTAATDDAAATEDEAGEA